MTSMKVVQFSRPPTPLVLLRPKFFHPLDLGRPISNEPLSALQRKHNPRMSIVCYQVFSSGRLSFSVSTDESCLAFH